MTMTEESSAVHNPRLARSSASEGGSAVGSPYPTSPQKPSPQAAGAADGPGPSRKAIVGWTLGMLAALGLAWFVGAVVVPVWRTRVFVQEVKKSWGAVCNDDITRLGGHNRAVEQLSLYLRLPRCLAPHPRTALALLRKTQSDSRAVPALVSLLRNEDADVRQLAALNLREIGDERAAGPLAALLEDKEAFVRDAASQALQRIAIRSSHGSPAVGARGSREAAN